jgi:hypothetical protein
MLCILVKLWSLEIALDALRFDELLWRCTEFWRCALYFGGARKNSWYDQ